MIVVLHTAVFVNSVPACRTEEFFSLKRYKKFTTACVKCPQQFCSFSFNQEAYILHFENKIIRWNISRLSIKTL